MAHNHRLDLLRRRVGDEQSTAQKMKAAAGRLKSGFLTSRSPASWNTSQSQHETSLPSLATQWSERSQHGLTSTRLYIGNIPPSATKRDVEAYFQLPGSLITEVKLMNGFGFISYTDSMHARDAVPAFHGSEFMGNIIVVNFARGPRLKDKPIVRPHGSAWPEDIILESESESGSEDEDFDPIPHRIKAFEPPILPGSGTGEPHFLPDDMPSRQPNSKKTMVQPKKLQKTQKDLSSKPSGIQKATYSRSLHYTISEDCSKDDRPRQRARFIALERSFPLNRRT